MDSSRSMKIGLSARDHNILVALHHCRFLTTRQVMRLFSYSAGTYTHVSQVLKNLADRGYVLRIALPHASPGGFEWVYTLARPGMHHLADTGYDALPHRFKPNEERGLSYPFLTHALCVSDFLIAAQLVTETSTGLKLVRTLHEKDLARHPTRLHVDAHDTVTVLPDALLEYHIHAPGHASYRMTVILELDRGTEAVKQIKRKLTGLLSAYGRDGYTVAFATTAGDRRARQLKAWCERVLTDRSARELGDVFLFTSIPHGQLDPKLVFLEPTWLQPFQTEAVSLLLPHEEADQDGIELASYLVPTKPAIRFLADSPSPLRRGQSHKPTTV